MIQERNDVRKVKRKSRNALRNEGKNDALQSAMLDFETILKQEKKSKKSKVPAYCETIIHKEFKHHVVLSSTLVHNVN